MGGGHPECGLVGLLQNSMRVGGKQALALDTISSITEVAPFLVLHNLLNRKVTKELLRPSRPPISQG